MVNLCNCSNCSNIGCKDHGFNSQYPDECQHFSQKKGCLSHSQAAEYLMKDVIKELTRCYDENEYDNYSLREIIALIRNGVK